LATSALLPARDTRQGYGGDFPLYRRHDPFPPRCEVYLTFEYQQVLTTGVGAYLFGGPGKTMQLNAAEQPTNAATHKPYGWDQIAVLYSNYKVLSYELHQEFSLATGGTDDIYVAALLRDSTDSSLLTGLTPTQVAERPMCSCKHLAGTGDQKVVISCKLPIYAIDGLTKLQFDADYSFYSAAIGTLPSNVPSVTTAVCGAIAAGGSSVTVKHRIVYRTLFWDRIEQAQS